MVKLFEAGFRDDPKCELCGHDNQTIHHLLHECGCPASSEARQIAKDDLPNVDIKDLPAPLQLGIPLAISCSTDATFWGSDPSDLSNPDPALGCHHSGKIIQTEVVGFVRDINIRYGLQYANDVVAFFRGSF
jgi:hypothetical protein